MMSYLENELNEKVVQLGLAEHISKLGWKLGVDESLGRPFETVFIQQDLMKALATLNPEIDEVPSRANEVISRLRAVLLGVRNDGLVTANEEFIAWLCGRRTIKYIGTDKEVCTRAGCNRRNCRGCT